MGGHIFTYQHAEGTGSGAELLVVSCEPRFLSGTSYKSLPRPRTTPE